MLVSCSVVENIQEFSNGCTRTCTGTWKWNQQSNTYTCPGTAGPLLCDKGMGNTDLTEGRVKSLKNQTFDRDGMLDVPRDRNAN